MAGTSIRDRIAAAPISWGVSEAPGWGHEIAADRVLAEMRELGLRTTELGPTGYLGTDGDAVRATLAHYDMRLLGGFLPVPLHVDPHLDLAEATDAIATLAAGGAEMVVLAARSGDGSYDRKVQLSDAGWGVLVHNLDRVRQVVSDYDMTASLHPHVGTAVEDRASVLRLLDVSDIPLCLDTGHLVIGGMQPAELLAKAADRITHVHLKNVDIDVAATVSGGDTSYLDAVRAGLYTPLDAGDLDIAGCVTALQSGGYRGWYVLEQDCALHHEPPPGAGPIDDVRRSIEFLNALP